MLNSPFKLDVHPGLRGTSRLRVLIDDRGIISAREWAVLVLAGMAAAALSTLLDFSLRIPGHAILRAVFPMAVGLAMVPRYGAGTVMGASALLSALGLQAGGLTGDGVGLGALTSLTGTGPFLDWTLRRARGGWRQYLMFSVAGLSSNLLALAVRGTAKAVGWEQLGRRPLEVWLPQAAITYTLCGALAGFVSGAILFYARPRARDAS